MVHVHCPPSLLVDPAPIFCIYTAWPDGVCPGPTNCNCMKVTLHFVSC